MDYQGFKSMKVNELKTLCKEQGLKQDGKKEVLIQRLLMPQESDKKSVNKSVNKRTLVFNELLELPKIKEAIDRGDNKIEFTNEDLKPICQKHKFKNHFDMTKSDYSDQLPELIRGKYSIVHQGDGKHFFIKVHAYMKYENPTVTVELIKKSSVLDGTTCNSESDTSACITRHCLIEQFMKIGSGSDFEIVPSSRRQLKKETKFIIKKSEAFNYIMKNSLQIEIDGMWAEHSTKKLILAELKHEKKGVSEFDMKQIYNLKLFHESQAKWKREGWIPVYLFITKTGTSIDVYQYDFKDETMMSMYLVKSVRYQWIV